MYPLLMSIRHRLLRLPDLAPAHAFSSSLDAELPRTGFRWVRGSGRLFSAVLTDTSCQALSGKGTHKCSTADAEQVIAKSERVLFAEKFAYRLLHHFAADFRNGTR